MEAQHGVLYLVATPLGNLQDLSARAIETLRTVDLVVAEDTRRARQLLSHLGIHKPLESFHGDSDEKKLQRLLRSLRDGQKLAYVSDGGTPGVADPGRELVRAAAGEGIMVSPIPGPAAVTAALSVCGFVADRFIFAGFLPRKAGDRAAALAELRQGGLTVVLYEAPHRVLETLAAIAEAFPERDVFVGRELTKQHEELLRGTAAELLIHFEETEPRGEFVLVIAPGEKVAEAVDEAKVRAVVARMVADGMGPRAIGEVLAELGVAGRREGYQMALAVMKEEREAGEGIENGE